MIITKLFAVFFTVLLLASCLWSQNNSVIELQKGWKFHTGDSLKYAQPEFNDSTWKSIQTAQSWEKQGYDGYDGYAWYRMSFFLPSIIKQSSFFQDSIRIFLGRIDDTEQTFLNGQLIGQNAQVIYPQDSETPKNFTDHRGAYALTRCYILPLNDPRILWNQNNVLAVRVHDHGGDGGFYESGQNIRVTNLADYIKFDVDSSVFVISESGIEKTVCLKNRSGKSVTGELELVVKQFDTGKVIYSIKEDVTVKAQNSLNYSVNIPSGTKAMEKSADMIYRFIERETGFTITRYLELPYFQTSRPLESPKINGPAVLGARPNCPILYLIPTSGQRPIEFSAQGCPDDLNLNSTTGVFSGVIKTKGEYLVKLEAKNAHGIDTKNLKIIIGDKIALTPPMGWNSWYIHYDRVSDKIMRQAADLMITSGMAYYGYQYVNIDDCWMVKVDSDDPEIGGPTRDAHGRLLTNKRFPDMKAMTEYIHSKGLKAGIYISPGPQTCAGYAGSYQHEQLDAETFSEWGFDFLKYDWCSYSQIARSNTLAEYKKPYQIIWQHLQNQNRDIVLNLCQYGMGDVWTWGAEVGNCWRTTGDLGLERSSHLPGFYSIGFSNAEHWQYAKPGAWNDPDYILIGWVGSAFVMGEGTPTSLTASEQYSYMSMWCLMAAPLIFSGDMAKLDAFTLNILCNPEVIAIDQDPLGKQAQIVKKTDQEMIMVKELEDGSKAIGLFNLSEGSLEISFNLGQLDIRETVLRNLWRQKDMGKFSGIYKSKIPRHGVELIKVSRIQ